MLTIGVARPGGMLRDLVRVGADLACVSELFCGLGYRRVPLPRDATAATLRERLGRWLDRARLGAADQLVIYYSGHGCVAEGNHYLCPAGFDRDRLATTAVGSPELVELVLRRTCRPGQLWLILDCCQAGGVVTGALLRGLDAPGSATFLLAASGSWGHTADGSFSSALTAAVRTTGRRRARGAGARSAASLDEVADAINTARGGSPAIQASLSASRFDLLEPAADREPSRARPEPFSRTVRERKKPARDRGQRRNAA